MLQDGVQGGQSVVVQGQEVCLVRTAGPSLEAAPEEVAQKAQVHIGGDSLPQRIEGTIVGSTVGGT
eukprot:9712960-Lingulodinium_polyedra.AAC.1